MVTFTGNVLKEEKMKKYFVCMMVVFGILVFSAISAFSQDPQAPAKDDTPVAQTEAPQAAPKMSDLSIYGEVQSVNVQASSMIVQYYDYDNDEEKTLDVAVGQDSKLENVKALGEIKKGDWVDVAYIVTDGKSTAKMISVEVEEPAAEENSPADTVE
jgi:uncharacterized alpha/beta hydrolase family protein